MNSENKRESSRNHLLFGEGYATIFIKEKGVAAMNRQTRIVFGEMVHICVRTVSDTRNMNNQQDFCFETCNYLSETKVFFFSLQ